MAGRYYKASILADIGKNIVKYGWPILIELVVLGFALCFYFFKWVEILNYTQGAFWNFLGGIFDWTSSSWLGLTLFEFFNSWLGGLNNAILSILLFIPIWILSLLGLLIGSIIHIAFWIVILIFVLVLIVLYYLICFVLLMSIYFVLPAASVIFALIVGIKRHSDSEYDSYPIISHLTFALLSILLPIGLCVSYYIVIFAV